MNVDKLVFLLDVDNTLLDNDKVKENIYEALVKVLGEEETKHFWKHHDSFRTANKLVDFPKIVHEYCHRKDAQTCDAKVGAIFANIDFPPCVIGAAGTIIQALKKIGKVVIFTEGDAKYQQAKVEKSGLKRMVDEVLLWEHKMEHLEEVKQKYAGSRIVVVEDKLDNLEAVKKVIPSAYTIQVMQGHHALEPKHEEDHFTPDLQIENLSELLKLTAELKLI